MMPDMEKVIKGLEETEIMLMQAVDRGGGMAVMGAFNCLNRVTEAIAMLKEHEAVQWINVKDKLPEKDGQYLVVYTFFDYRGMGVVRFSHNLHEIDEYIFDTENRPGWYESDDEVGYFERTTVTHWAKLPEFPKEGR